MRGINKVILVGTLGRDPETRSFPNGGSITNFSIATSDVWNDKNTGERREQTEWHRITLSGRLGDIAQQYLRKGSQVYIEGSLHTRQWKDPETGQDRFATEIRGYQLQMLGGRQNSGDWNNAQSSYNQGYNSQANGFNGGYTQPNQFGAEQGNNFAGYSSNNAGYQSQNGFNQYGNMNQNAGFQNNNAGFAPQTAPSAPTTPTVANDAVGNMEDDDLPF